MVAVMADVVEGWTCFFFMSQGLFVWYELEQRVEDGGGVSLEQSEHQEASWHFQIVLKPSWHTDETRNVSLKQILP